MKKLISLLMVLVLTLAVAGCTASSKLEAYEPVYSEKIQLNTQLKFKAEYDKAISKETKEAITDYLSFFVAFYNSVDASKEVSPSFTQYFYMISNNFMGQMDVLASPLVEKMDAGQTLEEKQQLFWDAISAIYEIPVKVAQIDSAAYKQAQDALPQAKTEEQPNTEGESAQEDAPKVEKLNLDQSQWEELFNRSVEIFNMLYEVPFAK